MQVSQSGTYYLRGRALGVVSQPFVLLFVTGEYSREDFVDKLLDMYFSPGFTFATGVVVLTIILDRTNAQVIFDETKTESSNVENSTMSTPHESNMTMDNTSTSTTTTSTSTPMTTTTTTPMMMNGTGFLDSFGNPIGPFPPQTQPPFESQTTMPGHSGIPGMPGPHIDMPDSSIPTTISSIDTSTVTTTVSSTTVTTTVSSTTTTNDSVIIYPEVTSFGDNSNGTWKPGKFPPPGLTSLDPTYDMNKTRDPSMPDIIDANNRSATHDLDKSKYDVSTAKPLSFSNPESTDANDSQTIPDSFWKRIDTIMESEMTQVSTTAAPTPKLKAITLPTIDLPHGTGVGSHRELGVKSKNGEKNAGIITGASCFVLFFTTVLQLKFIV